MMMMMMMMIIIIIVMVIIISHVLYRCILRTLQIHGMNIQ